MNTTLNASIIVQKAKILAIKRSQYLTFFIL